MQVFWTMQRNPKSNNVENFLDALNEYAAGHKDAVKIDEYFTIHGAKGNYTVASISLKRKDDFFQVMYAPGLVQCDIEANDVQCIGMEMLSLTPSAFIAANDIMDLARQHCGTEFSWRPENALRQVSVG